MCPVSLRLDELSDISLSICIAITRVLLEGPVVAQAVFLNILERDLPSIDALFEGGSKLDADISHGGLGIRHSNSVFAGRCPGCGTCVDLGVVIGPSGRSDAGSRAGEQRSCSKRGDPVHDPEGKSWQNLAVITEVSLLQGATGESLVRFRHIHPSFCNQNAGLLLVGHSADCLLCRSPLCSPHQRRSSPAVTFQASRQEAPFKAAFSRTWGLDLQQSM